LLIKLIKTEMIQENWTTQTVEGWQPVQFIREICCYVGHNITHFQVCFTATSSHNKKTANMYSSIQTEQVRMYYGSGTDQSHTVTHTYTLGRLAGSRSDLKRWSLKLFFEQCCPNNKKNNNNKMSSDMQFLIQKALSHWIWFSTYMTLKSIKGWTLISRYSCSVMELGNTLTTSGKTYCHIMFNG